MNENMFFFVYTGHAAGQMHPIFSSPSFGFVPSPAMKPELTWHHIREP